MESCPTPQIHQQVWVQRLFQAEVVLVRFEGLIDASSVIDFLIYRADELKEAIVSCPIYVVDGFNYET